MRRGRRSPTASGHVVIRPTRPRKVRPAMAALPALLLTGCCARPSALPAPASSLTDPDIGPAALRTHAGALYITPAARVADERLGQSEAQASISYSGFTSTGRF